MISTDSKQIDFFPAPTSKRQTAAGGDLNWHYSNLISAFKIGVTRPEKLRPGPLFRAISFFAPASLVVAMQVTARTRWSEL